MGFIQFQYINLGLFDQDLPERMCLQFPEAYRRLHSGVLFSAKHFFATILSAVLFAAVSLFGLVGFWSHGAVMPNGQIADLWMLGWVGFFVVIMGLIFTSIKFSPTWSVFSTVSLLLSLFLLRSYTVSSMSWSELFDTVRQVMRDSQYGSHTETKSVVAPTEPMFRGALAAIQKSHVRATERE